jgi:hypothetical protein
MKQQKCLQEQGPSSLLEGWKHIYQCQELLPSLRLITGYWLTNTLSNGWKSSSGCRKSKLWIVEPFLNLAKSRIKLPRHKFSILIGLITGHSRLNEHLFRMDLVLEPLCQSCRLESESAFHFTCICPARSLLRANQY